jgi:hypothetical protein
MYAMRDTTLKANNSIKKSEKFLALFLYISGDNMACTNNMSFANPEWGFDGVTFKFPVMKTKFRWYFSIQNITGDSTQALPCIKASRPKIQFREMQAEHLNETIHYPSKPDWQPINITLLDRCIQQQHPIFTWLRLQYDPQPSSLGSSGGCKGASFIGGGCGSCFDCSNWFPCVDPLSFKTCACLQLYDGCGEVIESWVLEHCYPQTIDFGELDMTTSEVVTADVTLRYDRAFQTNPFTNHILYSDTTTCVTCTPDPCSSSGACSGQPSPPPQLGMTASIKNPDFMMI